MYVDQDPLIIEVVESEFRKSSFKSDNSSLGTVTKVLQICLVLSMSLSYFCLFTRYLVAWYALWRKWPLQYEAWEWAGRYK